MGLKATVDVNGNATYAGEIASLNLTGFNRGDLVTDVVNTAAPNSTGMFMTAGSFSDPQKLQLCAATATTPGVITETTQTIGGAKTFNSAPILNSLNASTVLVLDASKNIASSATTSTELSYVSGVTSSIQAQINSLSGSYLTALTGDGTASGPGSAAFTLSTVNSNVGSFGSASSVAAVTINAKGLTTSASAVPIVIAESQVTNLVTDLAGKASVTTGTWTPTLGDATNNFTASTAAGFYQIFDKTVFFNVRLAWSSKGSATGALRLSLPFASVNSSNYRGAVTIGYGGGLGWSQILKDCMATASINPNVSYSLLWSCASDGSAASITAANCLATGDLIASGFYRIP